jgi:FkbM family methyltransferase
MSAIVGRKGSVHVIEGSERNATGVENYAQQHQVTNVKVTHAIVSSKKEQVVFKENLKASEKNMITFDQRGKKNRMAMPLDEILSDDYVDHLYLTINGAEPEALDGAEKILKRNPNIIITYPLDFATLNTWGDLLPNKSHNPIFVEMHQRRVALSYKLVTQGYRIAIANGPHTPSANQPFLFAAAIKCEESELFAMGFQKHPPLL